MRLTILIASGRPPLHNM